MGLFKKIADYQGTTHGVDPTGHNHSSLIIGGGYFGIREDTLLGIASIEADIDSQSGSIEFEITPDNVEELNKLLNGGKAEKTHTHTNDSWLTTLLAGKADVEHTHNHLDDGESQVYINGEDGIIGIEVSTQQGGYEMEITPENAGELIALLEGNKADKVHNHTASAITDFANAVNGLTKKSITINEIGGGIVITCEGGFGTKQGTWRADITYAGTNYKGGGILVIKNDIHTDPVISYNGYETIITDEYIYRRYTNGQTSEAWTKTKIDKNPVWGDITGLLANQTDLQTALDGKAASSHTQAISTITGLQSALDGKLDGDVVELEATVLNPIVVDDMPVGKLILITQNNALVQHPKLKELIVKETGSTDLLHFHLNSGELTNTYYLVRRFTWVGGFVSHTHNFVEVVGAWD